MQTCLLRSTCGIEHNLSGRYSGSGMIESDDYARMVAGVSSSTTSPYNQAPSSKGP
jgi:hypothetical protein